MNKLTKHIVLTFLFILLWITGLTLIFHILQILNFVPKIIAPSFLLPFAVTLTSLLTYLRVKKAIKNPQILEDQDQD